VFLRYFDFVFAPFRAAYNKVLGVKSMHGNIKVDVNRAKSLKARGQNFAGSVNQFQQQVNPTPGQVPAHAAPPAYPQQPGHAHAGQVQQGAYMQQAQPPGMPGMPGMPGTPLPPGVPNPTPPIRTKGFWFFKQKFCTQCEQQLDRTWDACPYCAQIAQQVLAAPAKQALKTQAFVLDAHGGPGSMQLLGWIIPLQGPQKGELFTLSPVTTIGTDPKCTIVLGDKFMSSKHAEIKAENGMWVLRDAGSTNGTYVNNKRIDRHELVDNDFVKFGSAMLKFKSL
jgi:hypothetical protein